MNQYFAVNLNLYVYFLSLISLYDIVVKKLHLLMTKPNKRQKLPLKHIQRIGWMDRRTDRRTDGRTEVTPLHYIANTEFVKA